MKYSVILFDFDGTLVPSLPLWIKAFHAALGHYGIAVSDDEVVRRCFFRSWSDAAADFGIQATGDFSRHVETGLRNAFLEAELYPFARDVLVHCRKNGLLTALVTSSPRVILADIMPRLQMGDLFDAVITGDDVRNYKPHPEPLHAALNALGKPASEAIMVGDSQADMLAGKAAGTATALFLPKNYSSYSYGDVITKTNSDLVFYDHTELPCLIGLPAMS
jgi:pyrophosphatase PpaX